MIKLIVSDMDGTLFTDDKRFPPDFFEILAQLHEKGIHFVAGSGRSYPAQKQSFAAVADKMDFICDNGAYIVENGKLTFLATMPRDAVVSMANAAQAIGENIFPILCGVKNTYLHTIPQALAQQGGIQTYYAHAVTCDDFSQIDDDIFKIAICDLQDAGTHLYPPLQAQFGESFGVAHSGLHWVDIMQKGINKGSAVRNIQKRLGITPQETMVFGDFYNDVEMLACAQYSFIMENADPDMFQYGNYRAPSNEDYGVATVIRRHVLENIPFSE